jgi:hypothetical protein
MTGGTVQAGRPATGALTGARPAGRTTQAMLLLAGRAEAGRLMRSPLVLAGLVISAALLWINRGSQVPLWWAADIGIGSALLAMAGAALIAAHLAAGRDSRDAMTDLYESYPAPPAVRTGGLLLGACGPVVLAAALSGAAVGWLDSLGAVGSPRLWVLAGGLLLIALGGVLGVALGRWLPHPMTGILTVLVAGLIEIDLVLSVDEPIHLPGGTAWLFPWSQSGWVLHLLPGMTVPYPPPAHLDELAGLITLACVAALWRLLPRRIAAVAGALSLALAAWSCWVQVPPVPERTLAAIVAQATQPVRHERCTVRRGVRYCYYPAFASMVTRWAAPVDGVLVRVPDPGGRRLTVRQVVSDSFLQYPLVPAVSLTSNGPPLSTPVTGMVTRFQLALQTSPRLIPGTSGPPVYTGLAWPRGGSSLGAEELGLALSTAFWVTGLPTTAPEVTVHGPDGSSGTAFVPCLAAGQAREAIALWLAGSATPAARAAMPDHFLDGATQVGKRWIGTEETFGWGPVSPASLTVTAQGMALASAMLRLPGRQVESVLGARWPGWLSQQATDAQLAGALGIPLPPVTAVTQRGLGDLVPPPSPVCR